MRTILTMVKPWSRSSTPFFERVFRVLLAGVPESARTRRSRTGRPWRRASRRRRRRRRRDARRRLVRRRVDGVAPHDVRDLGRQREPLADVPASMLRVARRPRRRRKTSTPSSRRRRKKGRRKSTTRSACAARRARRARAARAARRPPNLRVDGVFGGTSQTYPPRAQQEGLARAG